MTIVDLTNIKSELKPGSRLLGLDLGSKTIGLALTDTTLSIATPLKSLPRAKFSHVVESIMTIVRTHGVGGVVIGLPLNLNGSEGPAAQSARAFARNLAQRLAIPVCFWDERLSTAAVTRTLLDADASRKRRAQLVDKMAAAFILQGAIDRLQNVSR